MRCQFAVFHFKGDCYLVVRSINLHDTYLSTHFRTIQIEMNITEIDRGKDM